MVKTKKEKTISTKQRLGFKNDEKLYSSVFPNWEQITLCEQLRCMNVNQLRVEYYGLNPLPMPNWEV